MNATVASAAPSKTIWLGYDDRTGMPARFLFAAQREDMLDLLEVIDIVPGEHLHERLDGLLTSFLVRSTDLPLRGSQ
jgi:hypothetical protein